MNPLQVITKAIDDSLPVTIRTNDRKTYSGRPLHIGPRSVWLVVSNVDMFIPFEIITAVEICPISPEGN